MYSLCFYLFAPPDLLKLCLYAALPNVVGVPQILLHGSSMVVLELTLV